MDRIETPQNQRSRDTRAAVLDAAWELLEQSGGSAMTMAAVAEAADISRRGLYLHFPSRGLLLLELRDHVDAALGLEESLRPYVEARDALVALDAFAAHIAGYQPRIVNILRAVDRSRHDDEDAAALWDRSMEVWYEACCELAGRLDAEGYLIAPWTAAAAADLMWSMMSVELVDDLTDVRGWTTGELAERLRVLFRRTLCGDTAEDRDA